MNEIPSKPIILSTDYHTTEPNEKKVFIAK